MATLTLRTVKGSPLTNAEVDANFTALNNELATKQDTISYTAADILSKIKTVDGVGSGLDADALQGNAPATANTANSIVLRDGTGNFAAGTITATLSGNATSATTATHLAGGAVGTIPYQSASGTTAQLTAGTSGQYLRANGSAAPSWTSAASIKTDLGLNNVENTAISTWAGTSNITTLGTVTNGTWNATTIGTAKGGTGLTAFTSGGAVYATSTSALTTGTLPVASGGTGATTASAARAALGLVIGVDVHPATANIAVTNAEQTFSAKNTFANTIKIQQAFEKTTVTPTAAAGTVVFDVLSQSILYYTSNATSNWALNVRGDSVNTLNSIMAVGDTVTIVFMAQQGGTAYFQSGFQIDGVTVTPKWEYGLTPYSGYSNSIDAYTLSITKTGNAAYTVIGTQTKYS